MDLSTPTADGIVRPRRRRARRLALVLATLAALAGGGAHAALADGVQLTFSQNPVAAGATETMTAQISSSLVEPDGSVTFVAVSGPVTGTLDSSVGEPTTDLNATTTTATFSTSSLGVGTYTIKAEYSPGLFTTGVSIMDSDPETLVVGTGTTTTKTATQVLLSAPPSPILSTSPVTLIATVLPASGLGTPTGTVDFEDMSSSPAAPLGTGVPLVGGVATLVLPNLSPGPHAIIATYNGDSSYNPSSSAEAPLQSNTPVSNVYSTVSTVTTSPETIADGDPVIITATIQQTVAPGEPTPASPTGGVTFSSTCDTDTNGQDASLGHAALGTGPPGITVAPNEAAIELNTLAPCAYTIDADYDGDGVDESSTGTATLTVLGTRASTNISYTGATSGEYGHAATFSARVTDQSGNALSGRTVVFALPDEQQCSGTSDSNGEASCSLAVSQDVPGGTLTVSVPRDLQTTGRSINLNFTVTQQPTTLTTGYQLGQTMTTLTGTLLGDLGPLANQTLALSLGSETCSAPTTNAGVATCTVPTITGQPSTTLNGTFAGTTDYAASSAGTIAQLVFDTSLQYTGAATAAYHAPATLSAVLTETTGTRLSGRTVTFTLGTQSCTGTTDANGVATCTLPSIVQDSGAYTVNASYGGDGFTNGTSTSAPFAITLAPTTTAAATPAVGSSATTLSATLTSSGTPLAGKLLTLSLGANSCTATTAASGVASCAVTTPTGSSATLTATFAGDLDYATSNDTKTVALLAPATLTYNGATATDYDDIALLSATLLGPNRTPLVLQRVTFTMGSQSCIGITDLHGVAFCLILVSQPSGSYPLTVAFAGSSTYAATTAATTFAVTHEETTVAVTTAATALVGSSTTLSGVLLEDGIKPVAGRTLTLKLGTQACTGVTSTSGVATCKVTASGTLGPVTASGSFTGDSYYAASAGSTQSLLYALAPGGGTFVIGDRSTTGVVTFWGSQWSKSNALSDGSAPSSFKGFALRPTAPTCGVNWSTDPGNSAPPPSGPLPTYMAVIVTSSTSKSGSTISGNTIAVVVVKTASGYDGNPGHAGTGTVVATV
ncbi:MAG TPA: Ig-like domain-containing protein, partial [Gaiellaceae bacterium]|nr:Ig-like domain-containing protein [Gaiellaceae bacterium]